MFTIENELVYKIKANGKIKQLVGQEYIYRTEETETDYIYTWQKFNTELGIYEDDLTCTREIQSVIPTNGVVTISK